MIKLGFNSELYWVEFGMVQHNWVSHFKQILPVRPEVHWSLELKLSKQFFWETFIPDVNRKESTVQTKFTQTHFSHKQRSTRVHLGQIVFIISKALTFRQHFISQSRRPFTEMKNLKLPYSSHVLLFYYMLNALFYFFFFLTFFSVLHFLLSFRNPLVLKSFCLSLSPSL